MITSVPSFDTMTEAINWLILNGYNRDFNLEQDCIVCRSQSQKLFAEDLIIDYFFRFEGDTDPGDENIVYGIRSTDSQIQGVMVSAYGVYADAISPELSKKLFFKS